MPNPYTLLSITITGAVGPLATTSDVLDLAFHRGVVLQANFTYGGSGGASVDAYVQTTLDGGVTWYDVAEFSFATSIAIAVFNLSNTTPVTTEATPTDGTLTSNTAVDGILGDRLRVKYLTTGTYAAGTALLVTAIVH